jgi:hypothetical protein|tara:strand:+ start:1679 stop:1855 length:177 start_codon:yes stop_codon:yes gene_type:complete
MVDLEPEDYGAILRWFEAMYSKVNNVRDIPMTHKRTFWKLTFLAEDKIKEVRETKEPE